MNVRFFFFSFFFVLAREIILTLQRNYVNDEGAFDLFVLICIRGASHSDNFLILIGGLKYPVSADRRGAKKDEEKGKKKTDGEKIACRAHSTLFEIHAAAAKRDVFERKCKRRSAEASFALCVLK